MCSLLARLRDATQHDHLRLDRHPRLSRLLKSDLNLEGYADSLAGLHGAQSRLEDAVRLGLEALDFALPASEAYRLDARGPALRDDIERLGAETGGCYLSPLAAPERLETLIGLLYVLEGSRLGAPIIARHVRASLGPMAPLRFFTEADGANCWPSFRAFAKQHESLVSAEETAQNAKAAFALFQHSLDTSPAMLTRQDRLASPLSSLEVIK